MLLSQYLPSRVSFSIRDGLYCGGHGAPRFLSAHRFVRVGRTLISIPDSPLVGPRPLLLLTTFHPFLRGVVFSLWLFVASCGTGWASTPSCNLRPPFHISLLTTKSLRRHSHYAHCQPLQLTYGRASSSQVIYLLVFNICCSLPHFGTIGAFPFGRLTCVLSALPIITLDLSVRGTGHLYPPFALSGRLLCGWYCFIFDEVVASVEFSSNVCCDFFTICS